MPLISVVVPVYQSEKVLAQLVDRITYTVSAISDEYEIILSDDCSKDGTWDLICQLAVANTKVKPVKLIKNSGQWLNTLHGVKCSKGNFIVIIDDDLEYQPEDIQMLYKSIINSDKLVVFGIAKTKYREQKKYPMISMVRKRILELFWQTEMTDSFMILRREVVFNHTHFMPDVFLQAYINSNVDKMKWGYCAVGFSKRLIGMSQHNFKNKVSLFFLYTVHYHFINFRTVIKFANCIYYKFNK